MFIGAEDRSVRGKERKNRLNKLEQKEIMKKVIAQQEQTINIEHLNDNHIIGIKWNDNSKVKLVNTREGFCSMYLSEVVVLNKVHTKTLQEYIKYAMKEEKVEVFVFDSTKELLNWMLIEENEHS